MKACDLETALSLWKRLDNIERAIVGLDGVDLEKRIQLAIPTKQGTLTEANIREMTGTSVGSMSGSIVGLMTGLLREHGAVLAEELEEFGVQL